MADMNTRRSVTVNVGSERLLIKTDLPDGELKEILDYIDERHTSYERYNLEAGKRLALLALELGEQLFTLRKVCRELKVERDELNNAIKETAALLEEGQEHKESSPEGDWV